MSAGCQLHLGQLGLDFDWCEAGFPTSCGLEERRALSYGAPLSLPLWSENRRGGEDRDARFGHSVLRYVWICYSVGVQIARSCARGLYGACW